MPVLKRSAAAGGNVQNEDANKRQKIQAGKQKKSEDKNTKHITKTIKKRV